MSRRSAPATALLCLLLAACTSSPPTGSIAGWVWHDLCDSGQDGEPPLTSAPPGCIESSSPIGNYRGDGIKDPMEPLIPGLIVHLGKGECPSTGLAEVTTIDTDLSFSFSGLADGIYCVSIDASEEPNTTILRPGIWTFPEVSQGAAATTVTITDGQAVFDVNFGWDHQFLP